MHYMCYDNDQELADELDAVWQRECVLVVYPLPLLRRPQLHRTDRCTMDNLYLTCAWLVQHQPRHQVPFANTIFTHLPQICITLNIFFCTSTKFQLKLYTLLDKSYVVVPCRSRVVFAVKCFAFSLASRRLEALASQLYKISWSERITQWWINFLKV